MTELEQRAMRLYRARIASLVAKTAHRKKAAEVGCCEHDTPCYRCAPYEREPCDSCVAKMPLWNARQDAAREAGSALRALMNLAKKMA